MKDVVTMDDDVVRYAKEEDLNDSRVVGRWKRKVT